MLSASLGGGEMLDLIKKDVRMLSDGEGKLDEAACIQIVSKYVEMTQRGISLNRKTQALLSMSAQVFSGGGVGPKVATDIARELFDAVEQSAQKEWEDAQGK